MFVGLLMVFCVVCAGCVFSDTDWFSKLMFAAMVCGVG